MMNKYNSLSYRKLSLLSSNEHEVIGKAPNSFSSWRTLWLMSLFIALLFVGGNNAWAQVSSYTFAQSSGTYTPITSGTTIVAAGSDDTSSSATNIGFNFVYDNFTYTQFVANSNGSIRLGASAPTSQYTPISTSSNTAAIAPFARDGRGGVQTSLTGSAPNRVLTIEYANFQAQYNDASTTLNMQIKLYETSNLVQFVYGSSVLGTSFNGQVGLRGNSTGATDYYNRTTATNWAATTLGAASTDTVTLASTVFPATGQTYTFTPPVVVSPPNCATALLPANGATNVARNPSFSWTAATGFPTSYDVYLGTSSPAALVGNVAGTSYISPSALLANTLYYYKVVAKNANGSAVGCVEQSFTTGTSLLYCDPVYTTGKTFGDLIANITITGTTLANNSGTDPVNPAYTYFTGLPNYTATLQAGSTYSVAVTVGSFGSQNVAAWIDYNDNGVFETSERIGTTGSGTSAIAGNGTATFGITLACNPPLGLHRMRVRDVYFTAGTSIDPCATYSYGETEDYDVTISAADPCPVPNTLASANVTATSADLSWVLGCAETNWEVAVQAAGSGVPAGSGVATTATTYPASGLTASTAYEFYVRAACTPGSLYSTWAGPFAFTTVDYTPACADLVSPANGATNVTVTAGAVALTWNAPATSPTESAATSYDVYEGTVSGALNLIGNVTTLGANVTGLAYNQTIYWRIVPRNSGGTAVGPCVEWSFTTPPAPAFDTCAGATSLDALTSPITDSTSGLADDFTPSCVFGNSPDAFYSITVPNGYTLSIGQTSNDYDSGNALFYGSCASQTQITCFDDPDTTTATWTNSTGSTQTAYWVQDGYNGNSGIFTLAWTLTPPPIVVTSFAPTSVCSNDLATTVITLTGSNFTAATDVQLNGASESFAVINDTTIQVTLSGTSTAGTFVVYNAVTSGASSTSLVVNTSPTVDPITGNSSVCVPNTISLTDATALGVWSSSNPTVASVDAAGNVTGNVFGTATISYTVTDNGCSTASTYLVSVYEPVVITTQPTSQAVVTGNNAVFSLAATGSGLSYQWYETVDFGTPVALSNDTTFSGVDTNTLTITSAQESASYREYSCVVTGTSPCDPQTSNSASLTVGNTGIATNPTNVNLCNSGTAVFSVVGSGTVSGYQWYEDNGLGAVALSDFGDYSGANSASLSIANANTARNGYTYYVDVIGPANTVSSTTATLNIATGVSVSTQPTSQSVCRVAGTVTFSIVASGSVSSIDWQSSSTGTGPWTTVGSGNSYSVNVTTSTPVGVTYYQAVVNGNSGCPSVPSNAVTLTVVQPTISVTPSSASYCTPGSPVSLTASGASTYSWSPSTGLDTTSGDTVLASPSVTTTYTVTGTDGAGCQGTTTVTVSVAPVVTATATATPDVVCPGASVQLDVTPAQGVTNIGSYGFSTGSSPYVALTGATTFVINSGGGTADDGYSALQPIGFNFSFGGVNYTQLSVSSNGAIYLGGLPSGTSYSPLSGTSNNIIAFNGRDLNNAGAVYSYKVDGSAPNRIYKIQANNFYRYNTTTHTGNAQVWLYEGSNKIEIRYGAYSATWTSGGAQVGLRGSSTAAANVRSVSSTTWAAVTAASASNSSTASITQGTTNQVANGTMFTFTPGYNSLFTYSWSSSPAGFASTAKNPTVNPSVTTTYSVVVSSPSGCSVTANTTVNVVSGATITTEPVSVSQCAGTNASFTVVATGPSVTYQWRKNGTPITGNVSATTATLSLTGIIEADEDTYDVVVTPLCGPTATSAPVTLTVNDIPTAVPTSNGPVCENGTLNLTGTTSNGVTFAWTGPNGFTSSAQNPIISNVSPAAAGTYTFTATSVDGCSFSGTTSVVINPNPAVVLTSSGSATTTCAGEIKTLTASASGSYSSVASFGTNLVSDGQGTATYPTTISLPAGAVVTSASLQFTNVNSINGSYRSEIRIALSGAHTLAATQISTLSSGGLISPDPTVALPGFTATSGAVNLLLTETFNDGGAAIDATFGSAQLVINYTLSGAISWTPLTDLYSDANATIPYTGAVASTVYAKMTAPTTYTATSTTSLGCSRTAAAAFTIATSGCPSTTNVQPSQCGVTLPLINSYVYANLVGGAQGYRFRVTDMSTMQVQTIDKALRVFQLTQLTDYKFNTTYKIEVSVRLNNVWQPYYGSECTVTTPATTTQVQASQCGSTLTAMTNVIYADNVPFATGYRFRVTNVLSSNVQVLDRALREFRMNLLVNPEYNSLYTVEVAVKNTDGTYLPYGPVCNITTPVFPTTSLQNSQCDYTAVSANETFYADSYTGATTYRFRFQNTATSYSYTFDKPLRTFNLNEVPGLMPATTYSVQVSIELDGVFGPYGKVCSLTTPGSVARTDVKKLPFTAVAYPNPYAESFNLNVTTSSEENIAITVYDMIGKQIEVRQVSASAINTIQIGDRYPSGVYNVIVTQGDQSQNVRVIKR